jgi:hypothetical protein
MKSGFTAKTPYLFSKFLLKKVNGIALIPFALKEQRSTKRQERPNKKYFSLSCRSWRLGVLAVHFWVLPFALEACPRCVDATPYKSGLQLAVVLLLPVPFALVTALFFWIRRASEPEKE